MLVNTFGKKISASLVAKDSQVYIEVAKFVKAYTTILANPNQFLKGIGEPEINEEIDKLTWQNLTNIMQSYDFGFAEKPSNNDLLVYFNYAIEMGSISKKDKTLASVDDIADAQKNYYNFIDDATAKADAEYQKQQRITKLREREVNEIKKKLKSFNFQRWVAFSLSIISVILFCLGITGFFLSYPLVEFIGMVLPFLERQYIGSIILVLIAILMFYFCEKWQMRSKHEYQKINYSSQTIFSRNNSNFITEQILRRKLESLKRDLEIIKSELNDENKTFDVKTVIEKLTETNEYYKKFSKAQELLAEEDKQTQMSISDQFEMQDLSNNVEENENLQEISLEGRFDDEAYNEKFENSKKKKKISEEKQIANDNISNIRNEELIKFKKEERERLDKENIEKQVVENKNLDVQNKNNAEEKLNISDLSEEKLDIYIDYIKEILGMNESENEIQRER